jgi:hypothetical protein
MNKKFKNKFAVTGSKHLLKAFVEELKEIGYIDIKSSYAEPKYIIINLDYEDKFVLDTCLAGFRDWEVLILPQDYNKALELAKEVEEVIPEYVKCVVQWGWNKVDFQEGTIYKTSEQPKDITWEEVFGNYPNDFIPATKEEYEAQFKLYFGDKEVSLYKKPSPQGGDLNGVYVKCAGEVGTLEEVQAIVDFIESRKVSLKFGYKNLEIVETPDGKAIVNDYSKFSDNDIKLKIGCTYGTLVQAKKILEAGNKLK